jgi:hypothetical protein
MRFLDVFVRTILLAGVVGSSVACGGSTQTHQTHAAATQAGPCPTSTPAAGGSWVDKAVLSPDEEAKIRAWLRADKFQSAYSELDRLAQDPECRTNPRVYYLEIKAMLLEMRWSRSLPAGDLRGQEVNEFLYTDYAGTLCATSAAWLELFPSTGAIGTFMTALNKAAKDALAGRACQTDPWSQYPGASALVKRITELADLEIAAEKIPLPADPGPGTS